MNKYQEALMEVEEIAYKQYEDACYNKTTKARAMEYERKLKDDTKILQDLVDRTIPISISKRLLLVNPPIEIIVCGSCSNMVEEKYVFCPWCGQAIDWGIDND